MSLRRRLSRWVSSVAAVLASASVAAPPTTLAPTPPMGWNSWNWHGKKDITEAIVRETIDAMVSTGLRDAGYRYVVVDGGWRDTKLGPKGKERTGAAARERDVAGSPRSGAFLLLSPLSSGSR